ncbi:inositol polyphosphate 5-phosphatase OCRL-like [Dermacentor silvarum]|uniref:inositol polyphosphate 5-phosphatase OCRL-like n=1 Tax=Dermacentor silvarum TaxID=543639 RepID=UPI0018998272|nr:inositol polyphosphate 5-phosphatase OCRL-like [Dermacentor silvarum]XP_037577611.1 inositol polyphosphate 5-phosphatase OCRL-like [Dermacentor silvarum]
MSAQCPAAVKDILAPGDSCVAWLEAGLVQEWVKTGRFLLLVQHSDTAHGLLVCPRLGVGSTGRAPDVTYMAEHAFPIDQDFKCEIDTSCSHGKAGADMYVKVAHKRRKLLLELPATDGARSFLAQVGRAVERHALLRGAASDFSWLGHYGGTQELSNDSLLNSPGEPPRQTIAEGATPLAARESVVRLQLAMREDDYTQLEEIRFFLGTWNVNGQACGSVTLRDWLSAADPEPPQLYAVGFQELDLSKEALLFTDSPREEEWLRAVALGLHSGCRYRLVKLVRLVGMMLVLFVEERLASHVQEVEAHWVGTGILGKMGNKGAVAIRLRLHASALCFVCCHLAAHQDECQRRNQDYQDVCARLSFGPTDRVLSDHEQIFWLGDLNYRLADLEHDRVKTMVEQGLLEKLLEHDQLRQQQQQGKAFGGYTEGPITFRPTYKYAPGTQLWDTSEKQRAPAWCDRILWKGPHVKQLRYSSHESFTLSDHKPVSAYFKVGVKVIDTARYRTIYEEIMKKLDKLENEFLPQVAVDRLEVQFEKLHFMESQVQTLTVANTGQVPVEFCFRPKLDNGRYCKEWLRAIPASGAIKPGETCQVSLELCVDKRTAWQLNSASDSLEDILVLHLERGKDIFVTVSGEYEPSCYGCSLEALARIPCPVRELGREQLLKVEQSPCEEGLLAVPFEVPKELWLLVDHLHKYGLTQDDLFQQSGLSWELHLIRDALDARLDGHLPGSVHSMAEALLLFLDSLPEPVVPYACYQRCLDCSNNFILSKQVVSQMVPEVHRHTFLYLVCFLKELLAHSAENKLDAKLLANVFGPVLLRPKGQPSTELGISSWDARRDTDERKSAAFIYHFLMNDYTD